MAHPEYASRSARRVPVAEASEAYSPQEGTIFDDLSLLGALLFGEPIAEVLIDEVAPDRRH